jgi:hypothetical protein
MFKDFGKRVDKSTYLFPVFAEYWWVSHATFQVAALPGENQCKGG